MPWYWKSVFWDVDAVSLGKYFPSFRGVVES
jgi:hypothetical protein